jgi:pimeloyl-ACP methyl ester carboxylesterase
MADFGQLPSGVTLNVKPFTAKIEEQKIQDLKQLLKLSPIAAANFENSKNGRTFGINRDWLIKAKEYWLSEFDWRKSESRINSFPNFTAAVKDKSGYELDVHFIALFSQKPDAIPLAFFHGWPGSILEFLPILDILKSRYSPQDLPYHIIVPSLPGYTFSGNPPLDRDYGLEEAAEAMDALLVGLGFESGYLAQGGDLGSFVSKHLGANAPSCKGIHLNFCPMGPPKNMQELSMSNIEQEAMGRTQWFRGVGMAYALEHGTRTATIGFALAASPVSLLSWYIHRYQCT